MVFEAKMGKSALMKKIVEALKDIVSDAPFDCTADAMCLQAMDSSQVSLVSLRLEKSALETYTCERTIALGISMEEMHKILKCADKADTCILGYDDSPDVVNFAFENAKGRRKQDISLRLMDIDKDHLGIPDQQYACTIEMPSTEFQRTCKDIASFSETMLITAKKSRVVFSDKGNTVSNIITYRRDKDADETDKDYIFIELKDTAQESFSMKYLSKFTKSTSLSDRVRISLCNGVPLVVEYRLHDNGHLRFYLAPKIDDAVEEE